MLDQIKLLIHSLNHAQDYGVVSFDKSSEVDGFECLFYISKFIDTKCCD